MSANTSDKITDTRNAARPVSTTVSSGRSAGGSTLSCVSLTGWPTASKVHFVTYSIDSSGNPVAGSQLDCRGIVSGSNIGSFVVLDGTDTGNAIGDVVEMLPTASWGQDLADALTTEHNRTGTHAAVTTTSISNAGTLTQTGVATFTAVPLLPANTVETSDIQNAAVTADKLSTGAQTASVATSQTSSSTSYADLGTVGPAATVTIGANGLALVSLVLTGAVSTQAGEGWRAGFAVSGSSTVAASDAFSVGIIQQDASNNQARVSATYLVTGLTPGSNTFTAKYKVLGTTTGTFIDRTITVVPL